MPIDTDRYELVKVGQHAESGWAYRTKDKNADGDPFYCTVCFGKGIVIPLNPFGSKALKCPSCGVVTRIQPSSPPRVRHF